MSTHDAETLKYIMFRESTHLNHHRAASIDVQDYAKLIPQAIKFVQEDLPTSVLGAGPSEDPKLLLELSIRQWTGCGTPQNKPAAFATWIFLAFYRENVPLSLKAQVHSSLARAFFELAQEKGPRILNITRLYDAGKSANEAAALGLISPAVLMVASRIESAGFRRPEDNKFPEHDTERFERLADLWEAFDTRTAEVAEQNLKREAKVSKDPLSYFCAAGDCGIVATKKSTLRRCAGGCPPAFKPSYCSKYCQKADWKHHRPYCKPDAAESSVNVGDNRNALAAASSENARFQPGTERTLHVNLDGGPLYQPGPERSFSVNLNGKAIQISSNTIGPETMREIRAYLIERGL